MDDPKIALLRNISIIAFVIFVGWNLVNELSQSPASSPPNITESLEYKTMNEEMLEKAQPLLDSIEQLEKIDKELSDTFYQIAETQDEELQYQAVQFKGQYMNIMTKLTEKVGSWHTRNASKKNHPEMTMEEIEVDFEKLSVITNETTIEIGEVMKELRILLLEFKKLKK